MDRPNIAVCTGGELYGGVEQFVFTFSQELEALRDMNYCVILFSKEVLYEKLRELNAPIELVTLKFRYDLFSVMRIRKLLKERKINIVHLHGYKSTILAGIAAKSLRIRTVKTEHGKLEHSKGFGYLKMLLNLFLDRLVSRYLIDAIVFVSRDIKECSGRAYGGRLNRVIYNGMVPIEITNNEDIEIDSRFFNIGIIGRISEVKGHIYLLQAINRLQHLKDIRLYIFGEGPLEGTCRNFCHTYGLSERVLFMGFKRNILDYLKKLDLLAMPSLHEGLPYTILEAMYLKVPIVASEVGGVKEIVVDNVNGILVPPKDVSGLSDAIESVYKDQGKRNCYAEKGHERICKGFLACHMMKRYFEVYCQILR